MWLVYLKKHGGGVEAQKWADLDKGNSSEAKLERGRIIKAIQLNELEYKLTIGTLQRIYPLD